MSRTGRRIAVDAMGGDFAPAALVQGALRAVAEHDIRVLLVGDTDRMQAEMSGQDLNGRVELVHAGQVIQMTEAPTVALRQKPDASLMVSVRLVKEGRADAVISAGNTGAFFAGSLLTLGRLPGVQRPTIGAYIPAQGRASFLLDVGANPDCKPIHLLQFAMMGAIFVEHTLGYENPTIGLLSIGEEKSKGNELTIEAHALLRESGLNFTGNIEGRDVLSGTVDIVVCDGFVGNILLKYTESLNGLFRAKMGEALTGVAEDVAAPLKHAMDAMDAQFDYQQYGGVPMLGLDGVSIVCHGGSSPEAIKNAILVADRVIEHDINARIRERIQH